MLPERHELSTDIMDTPELNCIYLNLTNRCNLLCEHCWLSSGSSNDIEASYEIDLDTIKRAIEDAISIGLSGVKITGGEPFLRGDILELIDFLHEKGLETTIETNGTLITEKTVDRLKKNEVSLVCVSLDGASAETHDRLRNAPNSFNRVMKAIRLLKQADIDIQIIMTLYRSNIDELYILMDMLADIGVDSLSINPLVPSGRGKRMVDEGLSIPVERLIALNREIEEIEGRYPFNIYFTLPVAFKSMDSLKSDRCECNILNIIGLLGNGGISICGIGYGEDALVFGNIARDDIRDVWRKSSFLSLLRREIPMGLKGVCGRCILKGICLGYCRANAFTMDRDIFAPYWLCQEAYDKGLFPEARLI